MKLKRILRLLVALMIFHSLGMAHPSHEIHFHETLKGNIFSGHNSMLLSLVLFLVTVLSLAFIVLKSQKRTSCEKKNSGKQLELSK